MKIECTNTGKFINISLGREYEVMKNDGDFYSVIANDGVERRYHKKYFSAVEDSGNLIEQDEAGVENKVSINVVRTKIQCFVNGREAECIYMRGYVSNNCGTESLDGLNNLFGSLNYRYGDCAIKIFEKIIEEVVKYFESRKSKGCLVFSTNDKYPRLCELMDRMSTGNTGWFLNPISGNNIKMWWFIINQ